MLGPASQSSGSLLSPHSPAGNSPASSRSNSLLSDISDVSATSETPFLKRSEKPIYHSGESSAGAILRNMRMSEEPSSIGEVELAEITPQEPPRDHAISLGGRGYGLADGKVHVADPGTGKMIPGGHENIKRLKLGADYKTYALDGEGKLHVLTPNGKAAAGGTNRSLPVLPKTATDFAISHNGDVVFLDEGRLFTWSAAESIANPLPPPHPASVSSVAFDRLNRIWLCNDETKQVWCRHNDKLHKLPAPPNLRHFQLRSLVDGSVVVDGGHGRVFRHAGRPTAGARRANDNTQWTKVSKDDESRTAFDQLYEHLRGPRIRTELSSIAMLKAPARSEIRKTPWWKPSIFETANPNDSLLREWGDYLKAHFGTLSSSTFSDNPVAEIRSEVETNFRALQQPGGALGAPAIPSARGSGAAVHGELDRLSDDIRRNTNETLDKLMFRLGLVTVDPKEGGGYTTKEAQVYKQDPRYRKVENPGNVFSNDNVLFVLWSLWSQATDSPGKEIAGKLQAMLDKNVYLPLTTKNWSSPALGGAAAGTNEYEVLTSQLIMDLTWLYQAKAEAKGKPGDSSRAAADITRAIENHTLTKLGSFNFIDLNRAENTLHGMGLALRAMADPGSTATLAKSLGGKLEGDIDDLYLRAMLDMPREAKIVFRANWSAGLSTSGIIKALTKPLVVRPEASGQKKVEYLIDVHKKGSFTWIKIALRDGMTGSIGVRLGKLAQVGTVANMPVSVGAEGTLMATGEKVLDDRIYLTISNSSENLEEALRLLLKGDITALALMEKADVRIDSDRRDITAGRVNVSGSVPGFLVQAATAGPGRLLSTPSVTVEAGLVDYVSDTRKRHGPGFASHDVQVNRFSAMQKAGVGVNGDATLRFTGKVENAVQTQFDFNLPLAKGSVQKYWDRMGGAETEMEIKYTNEGKFDSIRMEVMVQQLGDLSSGKFPCMEKNNQDPEFAALTGKVRNAGKPATLVYGSLRPEAKKRIDGYDSAKDGPYKAFVASICHDPANWQLDEIMIRHSKKFTTNVASPLPVLFSSAGEVELHAILGRIVIGYDGNNAMSLEPSGTLFEARPVPPDFRDLKDQPVAGTAQEQDRHAPIMAREPEVLIP